MVGGEKQIQIAIAVKISVGETAPDSGLAKIRPYIERGIAEGSVAAI